MIKKVLAIFISIIAAIIGLKILGFFIMLAFGIVLGIFKLLIFLAIAVPVYFLIRNKFLN